MAFCEFCGKELREGEVCSCSIPRTTDMDMKNKKSVSYPTSENQNNYDDEVKPENRKDSKVKPDDSGDVIPLPFTIPTWDFSSWGAFWESARKNMGLGNESVSAGTNAYEDNIPIVPNCIKENEGEVPIKQYDFAILKTRLAFMKAKGRLQVTNKRLIFRAPGTSLRGGTLLQDEFDIMKISGISVQCGYRFSFLNFIVNSLIIDLLGGILCVIGNAFLSSEHTILFGIYTFIIFCLGLVSFFCVKKKFQLKGIFCGSAAVLLIESMMMNAAHSIFSGGGFPIFRLILSLLMLVLYILSIFFACFRPDMMTSISTSTGQSAVLIMRERGLGLFGGFGKKEQSATGYREVMPSKDTAKAVNEINAMIIDLQTKGDLAIDKWKEDKKK